MVKIWTVAAPIGFLVHDIVGGSMPLLVDDAKFKIFHGEGFVLQVLIHWLFCPELVGGYLKSAPSGDPAVVANGVVCFKTSIGHFFFGGVSPHFYTDIL